ncbi:carboxypeptidase-like regulatory domain-containing protein [Lacinutrix salivirga]
MKKSNYLFYFFYLSFCSSLISQNIKGIVLDRKTNSPIESAAIYFDNTTKGVITNSKGYFEIEYNKGSKTPLIISYLGYQKIILEDYKPNIVYKFLLDEDINSLEEVVLTSKDEWSREKKLNYFRNEFLGLTENGKSCTILNEDAIKLQFNKKTKQLTATANQQLIIINKRLNYKLLYDFNDFEINFIAYKFKRKKDSTEKPETRYSIKSVYYSGTTFFKDLNKDNNKRILKRREKTYKGSVLHFMRTLRDNKLGKDFDITSKGFKVKAEHYIYRKTLEAQNVVKIRIPKQLGILYKNKEQSFFVPLTEYFIIDIYGVFSPVKSLSFGGKMSEKRIGDTLPIDYMLNEEE